MNSMSGVLFVVVTTVVSLSSVVCGACRDDELTEHGEPKNTCLLRMLEENQQRLRRLEDQLLVCATCECAVHLEPVKENCEGEVLGSSCYELVKTKKSWHNASAHCQKAGGHLADVTSDEENKILVSLMKSLKDHVWLGGSDQEEEGTWRWIATGAPIDDADGHWNKNEPNGGREENCMNMRSNTEKWNDATCADKESFICEYEYFGNGV